MDKFLLKKSIRFVKFKKQNVNVHMNFSGFAKNDQESRMYHI